MCVSSFYRYVLEPELSFTPDGLSVPPVAVFNDLPQSPLLTLHLDVPHSWLVEAVWSPHDLDNIHLDESSDTGVHAQFELKNILVEGWHSITHTQTHTHTCTPNHHTHTNRSVF